MSDKNVNKKVRDRGLVQTHTYWHKQKQLAQARFINPLITHEISVHLSLQEHDILTFLRLPFH